MHTPEQIRDNLLKLLQTNQLTTYQICKNTDLPRSSVRRLTVKKQVPSLYTLSVLCNTFKIPLAALLEPQHPPQAALSAQEQRLLCTLQTLEPAQRQLAWDLLHTVAHHSRLLKILATSAE